MKLRIHSPGEWFFLVTAIVLIAGFIFWQSDLTADPPMYFSGAGQSLSTDPYMYPLYARNLVLYGDANPFDDTRWIVFEKSFVSFAAWVWFSITDTSLREANTVGIFLSILGLIFFLIGLAGRHRPWVLAVVALCYMVNVTLMTYGRLPYLENGLIFWSGLVFCIWSRYSEYTWSAVVLGLAVALATVTGKIFGAILIGPIVIGYLVFERSQWRRQSLYVVGTFTVTLVAAFFLLYQTHTGDAFRFLTRQSVGLHGYPEVFTSPITFLENLLGFGVHNHLTYHNPDWLLFVVVTGILIAGLVRRTEAIWRRLPRTTLFALAWVTLGWLLFTIPNYSPLRYSLFLVPAAIVGCFSLFDWLLTDGRKLRLGFRGLSAAISALLLATLINQGILHLWYYNDPSAPRTRILFIALAAGGMLGGLAYWKFRSSRLRLSPRVIVGLSVALVAVSLIGNAARIRRTHLMQSHYTILEANQDLGQIVGPRAVLTGPYAPTISFQTDHQTVIHFFGAAEPDSNFFERYPITHLAVDQSNLRQAIEDFPPLADLRPIATYWIRDYEVLVYNVAEISGNPFTDDYRLSVYERASRYWAGGNLDSAIAVLTSNPTLIQSSKAAGRLYADLLLKTGQVSGSIQLLRALAERYRTDFSIQLECGYVLQRVALQRKDRVMFESAKRYFERAVELNPFRADLANTLFEQTMQQYSMAVQPPVNQN